MSTVKLEVGAWYFAKQNTEYSYQIVSDAQYYCAKTDSYEEMNLSTVEHFNSGRYSGPYHIEPGDRVKPKPAGDKCWKGHDWGVGQGEFIVGEVNQVNWTSHDKGYDEWGNFEGNNILGAGKNWPISCLILLEKAAKASQDFQVGDEVEVLPIGHECWKDVGCNGDGSDPHICHDRDKGVLPIKEDWMDGSRYELIKSCLPAKCLKLIRRRAGEKAETNKAAGASALTGKVEPLPIARGCITASTPTAQAPAAPLNPRVLPSVSGSPLPWPDVRPGIELDKLPMDKSTKADDKSVEYSGVLASLTGTILDSLDSLNKNIGNIHNSDRERIRKIIPEIERKLTQLKGRL